MVIWVFAGGGQTELKGLIIFLENNFKNHHFERKTPFISKKPGPKPGKAKIALGKTGKDLAQQIQDILPLALKDGRCDMALVLDDLDCQDETKASAPFGKVINAIPEMQGIDHFIAFAAPEIESWLIADWEHTFGADRSFHSFHQGLRHGLSHDYKVPFNAPESYSMLNPITRSCQDKLSETIIEAVQAYSEKAGVVLPHFSKKIHSPQLLEMAQAKIIQKKCPIFAKLYHRLINIQ